MAKASAMGYWDGGISYAIDLDDSVKDDLTGCIVGGATSAFIAAIEAATGQLERLHMTGEDKPIGIDSIEGVFTYLVSRTQITSMSGDLPEDITGTEDDRLDAVQ